MGQWCPKCISCHYQGLRWDRFVVRSGDDSSDGNQQSHSDKSLVGLLNCLFLKRRALLGAQANEVGFEIGKTH
jgi:hypothetical protein